MFIMETEKLDTTDGFIMEINRNSTQRMGSSWKQREALHNSLVHQGNKEKLYTTVGFIMETKRNSTQKFNMKKNFWCHQEANIRITNKFYNY